MFLTTTKLLGKAHDRDFSTIRKHCASFGTSEFSANEPDYIRDAGNQRKNNHVRFVALGGQRWQLSDHSTLVPDKIFMGNAALGIFSQKLVETTGRIPDCRG